MKDWLSTKDAMLKLGVGSTTIKRWTDEGKLSSHRTPGGHRRINPADVERLLKRHSISSEMVTVDNLLGLLLENSNLAVFRQELFRLYQERGSWFEVADTLGTLVTEIGARWASGNYSIVEEHIQSERLMLTLAVLAHSLPVEQNAPVCLVTSLSGELHSLGLSMVQLCLRSAGINTLWVGVNTPTEALCEYIKDSSPDLVAVSASSWSNDEQALLRNQRLLAAVCEAQGVELIVGGNGAWPDELSYGSRCRAFSELKVLLEVFKEKHQPEQAD